MKRFLVGMAAAGAVAVGVRADVVTIGASKDNTLFESLLGNLSNGAGTGMFCGATATGGKRRALLAFDVASNVPAGSTVTSVTLRLSMSMTIALDVACGLHRVQADWGEGTSVGAGIGGGAGGIATPGDATWLHRFWDTSLWTTVGGDFAAAPSATQLVGGIGLYSWTGPGLVADVQSWLDAPAGNFGWLVRGDESGIATAKRFDTRENTDPNARPALIVEFTPPAACYPDCNGDGALNLADFGCFQTKFALGDPYADCNGDGALNLADFGCFQTRFAVGCP